MSSFIVTNILVINTTSLKEYVLQHLMTFAIIKQKQYKIKQGDTSTFIKPDKKKNQQGSRFHSLNIIIEARNVSLLNTVQDI